MRKVILYTAVSLDGFIAGPDDDLNWLTDPENPNPDPNEYGYLDFLETIGTTLMGYKTYRIILAMGEPFPYTGKENFVFSRKDHPADGNPVRFISGDLPAFVGQLKQQPGRDIWLVGGGQINGLLLEAGLIDQMILTYVPAVLGSGIRLFGDFSGYSRFSLQKTELLSGSMVQLIYQKNET